MNDFPLALVTGAAHRLGRSFALTLARTWVCDTPPLPINQLRLLALVADEIRALGVPVHTVKADLTDSTQVQSLFSSA